MPKCYVNMILKYNGIDCKEQNVLKAFGSDIHCAKDLLVGSGKLEQKKYVINLN